MKKIPRPAIRPGRALATNQLADVRGGFYQPNPGGIEENLGSPNPLQKTS